MATNLYWDANGTTSGAGTAGVASGTWGVNTFWSTDTSGVLTPSILTTTVSDDLIFAAGSDATGSSTLTLSGGQQAKSLTFNTGTISMAGTASPVLTLGGGGVTLSNTLGGTLTFGATLSSVLLGADQTWSNNSTQQLIVNSAVGGTASSGATNTWTVGGAAGQITVAGTIGNGAGGGTLALNKTGTGTLLLSGSNTFTGVVTVNAGKVSAIGVSDSVGSGLGLGSQVLLGTGATLDVQVASGSTNSTSRQLIGNGGFTLANTGNGNLIWNGNMTNTGTAATTVFFNNVVRGTNEFAGVIQNTNNGSTVNVNFQSTQIWKLTGSNTFTGVVTIGGGTVIADKLANQGTASSIGQGGIVRFGYFDNAPSTFEYVGNGGTSNMQVRLGASTGTINNDASFLHNGSGALVLSNGSFTLTGNGNPATAVTRNLIIGGNNTADNTIQGVIGNSNTNAAIQLVKSGTGKWILTGSNTYTGGTSFAAGTLGFANGAFGSSGTLSFVGGTVQYVSGNTQDISTRIHNSTSKIGVDTGANSVVWNGSLDSSNVAGLTKVGAGMLTLSGSNGYNGTTYINMGTLSLGSANALGGGGSITFGGGTLQYTSGNTEDYASRIVNSASAIALDTNEQSVLYAGNLVGSNTGGLTKMGSGVLTLSGSNGYSGLTSINAGTVSLGSVNALGGGGSITFGGGTLQAGTANATYTNRVTGSGSMMGIDSNGTGITLSGSLDATNTGGLTKMGSGVLTLSGSNGYSGTTYINVGTLSLGSGNALGGGGSITFGGGTLQAGTANATYTNRVTGSGSMMGIDSNGTGITLSGSLDATNTGGLTKMGSGVLTLSGSNGYSGATYINVGTLSLGSPNALAGGGSIMFGGGTLQFTSSNTGDYSARMINNGSAIALDTNGQNVTYAGDLVGSNTGGLTKVGAGALTLSGSNGYTGTTLINAGTISLGSTTALAGGGNITFGGGTLQFTSSNTADYASRIVNSGSAIALDTNGLNVTYSGDLVGSNTGGLTKVGAGNLTLSGSNTFTGGVTVNAGKLIAMGVSDSAGSGLGLGSQVLLGTGATLDVQVAAGSTNSTSRQLIGNGGFTLANSGSGNLIWNGNMTNTGTAATTVFFNNLVGGTNEFVGVIQNTNNGSTVNLTFQNTQIWKLTGSNTFTGVVTIGGGTVIADKLADQGTASSIGKGGIVRFGYFDNAPSTFEYVGSGATSNMQVRLGASSGTINNDASFLNNGSGALVLTNGSFTLTGNANPASAFTRNLIIGGNNTADNTIQGIIANGTSNATIQLVKSGTGKWILTGSNTYTGGTTFASGTLGFANNAFGSSGTLSFVGGTVQYVSGNTQDISTRIHNSTSKIGVDTGANSVVWNGSLDSSNVAGLTKVGAGMLTLSGSNGYNGTTYINMGTLSLGSANALGGGGSITFGGGTLQYTSGNTEDYASRIVNSASAIALDTNEQSVLYAGNLVGSNTGGLTKMGSGVLTLSGSNGYSGLTSINAGTVSLGSANALGGGGSITFGGGTLQHTTSNTVDYASRIVNSGSAIGVDTNGHNVSYAGDLVGSNTGGLTKVGAGALTLSGSNGYTGTTLINRGTLSLGSANALAGGGSITFGGGTLQYTSSNTADYASRIANSGSAIALDTNGQNVSYAGDLVGSNTGGLTK
ncbi:MAG: autotransporter-associated beta strand repeat-containing protein, partial [Verrucomicrobiota bacterium]